MIPSEKKKNVPVITILEIRTVNIQLTFRKVGEINMFFSFLKRSMSRFCNFKKIIQTLFYFFFLFFR